jgi:hypothetical protein
MEVAQKACRFIVWKDNTEPGCGCHRYHQRWALHRILAQNTRNRLCCVGPADLCQCVEGRHLFRDRPVEAKSFQAEAQTLKGGNCGSQAAPASLRS